MRKERLIEREYRDLKTQAAPDLWERIEAGLKEHPERIAADEKTGETNVLQISGHRESGKRNEDGERAGRPVRFRMRYVYGTAAVAASLALLIGIPRLMDQIEADLFWSGAGGGESFRNEAFTPTAAVSLAGAENGEAEAEGRWEPDAVPEEWEEEPERVKTEAEMLPETTAAATWAATTEALADKENIGETIYEDAAGSGAGISESETGAQQSVSESSLASGRRAEILSVGELRLAAYHPLEIPAGAETVPEDMMYFTENALKDTMLLCLVEVKTARFEENEEGLASRIVYDAVLKETYYEAEMTAADGVGVSGRDGSLADVPAPGAGFLIVSPIIGTPGPQAHTLYQLQEGGVYLLPLTVRNGDWEMVFPYAPQIQKTVDGQYLFHSGYYSLVGEGAFLVLGNQEGPNDYYYDRMFLREDDAFLPELVELIASQAETEPE